MNDDIATLLGSCEGFEWDDGNQDKNERKHEVTAREAEEVFFNQPQVLFSDTKHSNQEERYGILGITHAGRSLAVFFTIRHNRIRVISARDQKQSTERTRFLAEKEAA